MEHPIRVFPFYISRWFRLSYVAPFLLQLLSLFSGYCAAVPFLQIVALPLHSPSATHAATALALLPQP